ncbi:MAG: hypothetical protein ACOYB4_01970 [Methyloceanibacter sp.]
MPRRARRCPDGSHVLIRPCQDILPMIVYLYLYLLKIVEGVMPNSEDIRWFKRHFHRDIEAAIAGTPFDLDMMTALACQETGEIWSTLRKKPELSVRQVVALCVGDTLDQDRGRRAFPRTKAHLIAKPNGQRMFDIARQALVDMAAHVRSYRGAATRSNKFVHGFGIWQYDLQFFLVEPQYFLSKHYEKFDETLGKAVEELKSARRKIGLGNKTSLTDLEMAHVAIAYNTGRFRPERGLRQGFKSADGRFYGEQIFDFIRLSRTVPVPGGAALIPEPSPGAAIVPPPEPVEATGAMFTVTTRTSPLRLRSEPRISNPTGENVIAHLPDGHPVKALSSRAKNGFLEVETTLFGANLVGFASTAFLTKKGPSTAIDTMEARQAAPVRGIVAVTMPRRPGTETKRTAIADAHSLNEANQPGRRGTTPPELVAELEAIIGWLAVDKPTHRRYQPRSGLTFCNIYTHDFCHLAGVYLPRVWWTQRAIVDLTQGKTVQPLIGNTIFEMRANDLFRWLRDFGQMFGWRQTATLTELQQNANQGGLSLIIARRKIEGRSGHMLMVVPETPQHRARRNREGEVTAPLQSQAGARNFRRSTATPNWWKNERFAESAFWIHS